MFGLQQKKCEAETTWGVVYTREGRKCYCFTTANCFHKSRWEQVGQDIAKKALKMDTWG